MEKGCTRIGKAVRCVQKPNRMAIKSVNHYNTRRYSFCKNIQLKAKSSTADLILDVAPPFILSMVCDR